MSFCRLLTSDGKPVAYSDTSNALSVNVENELSLAVSESSDSILVYGFDGTNNQPLSCGGTGVLSVSDSSTSNIDAKLPAIGAQIGSASLSVVQNTSGGWTVSDSTTQTSLASIDTKMASLASGNFWSAETSLASESASPSVDLQHHKHLSINGTHTGTDAEVQVQYSNDNSTWYFHSSIIADSNGNVAIEWQPASRYVRLLNKTVGDVSIIYSAKH